MDAVMRRFGHKSRTNLAAWVGEIMDEVLATMPIGNGGSIRLTINGLGCVSLRHVRPDGSTIAVGESGGYTGMALLDVGARRFLGLSEYWDGYLPTLRILEVVVPDQNVGDAV